MNNETKLSSREAYLAMYVFLEKYYEKTRADDIGGLLGSMSLLADGGPADPAIEEDWALAIETACSGKSIASLEFRDDNDT